MLFIKLEKKKSKLMEESMPKLNDRFYMLFVVLSALNLDHKHIRDFVILECAFIVFDFGDARDSSRHLQQ